LSAQRPPAPRPPRPPRSGSMDPQSLVESICKLDAAAASQLLGKLLEERPLLAPPIVAESCPDLTFAPARSMTERRSRGTIKSFSEKSGFGFITCPELQDVFGMDVFLHAKQMGTLNVGDSVSFSVVLKRDNKPQAYDVHAVSPTGELIPTVHPFVQQQQQGGGSWGGGWKGGDKGGGWGMACWTGGMGCGGKGFDYKGSCGKGFGKKRSIEDLSQQQEIGQHSGTIKSFNKEGGFGFIVCPDLQAQGYGNDVFLHREQIGTCQVGQDVTFTAFLNSRGQPQARYCQPLGSTPVPPLQADPAAPVVL